MRYWVNKRISGSKKTEYGKTHEACFDLCLADDSCMGVSYLGDRKQCDILNYALASEGRFEEEKRWISAVKCHLTSPSEGAEGKYPFTGKT